MVDIVDDDDQVVATVTRAEMRAGRLQHRAVSIAVLSTDGRLLVHRRADTKDVWPGMWDLAAGGVVAAGETYEDAARRELAEELGVVADPMVSLGEGRFADDAVALIGRGYRCVHDGPFSFTDGEIAEVRWVHRAELTALMATERFVPDNVALLLPLLEQDRDGWR
jgi:8-oxo-dGTP pyrophosphatase MutT (NUDIX family)